MLRVLSTALAIVFFSQSGFSQTPAGLTVQEIVDRAAQQAESYRTEFRNLLSHETKSFEVYDRDGDVKKRRVVRSNFIIYPLSQDQNIVTEYRNVISVDGKPIDNGDDRTRVFFENLAKVGTPSKELEKLTEESQRFDLELFVSELTYLQAVVLSPQLRPLFEFKLAGREVIAGRETYVVEFRQIAASDKIRIGRGTPNAPGVNYDIELDGIKTPNERLGGKLWIDAQTFQIVREHRLMTIQPDGFAQRIAISENWFDFQTSDFGIMPPRRISHLQFDIDKKRQTAVKDVQVVFEYEKFTKPDVDVKASEVKRP